MFPSMARTASSSVTLSCDESSSRSSEPRNPACRNRIVCRLHPPWPAAPGESLSMFNPSTVTMCLPLHVRQGEQAGGHRRYSTWSPARAESRGRSSPTSTVHAPQSPSRQPILVPGKCSWYRITSKRTVPNGASVRIVRSFKMNSVMSASLRMVRQVTCHRAALTYFNKVTCPMRSMRSPLNLSLQMSFQT
jgi:hypothetical protein